MRDRLASFLIPPLIAVILLYQILSDLQIALAHTATLAVVGVSLAIAALAGLMAAIGPPPVRVGVLAAWTLLFLDVTFHLSGFFDSLTPEKQERVSRDRQRIADLHQIRAALDQYVTQFGPLPMPTEYGEGIGPSSWWKDWWDVSSDSGFLDFLVEAEILPSVPRDPVNAAPGNGDPREGKHYVYFVVPGDYDYLGGTCEGDPNRWYYLIAATDLDEEATRPPRKYSGSGCPCLWKDSPNFFDHYFDYVLCGSFESTPETRALAGEARARRAAAAAAEKEARAAAALAEQKAAELRQFLPVDERRVSDLLEIQKELEAYLRTVGPLPRPGEYGEAESSKGKGFWHQHWDVSGEDGDGDEVPFLDFLVEAGRIPAVPVDPLNRAAEDGDPRGGSQYVYFLLPPESGYAGGPSEAGENRWYYLLGITDLQSEFTRPPRNFPGSGCESLWRDQPNFFQNHFDYIVCGSFESTAESRAAAARARAEQAASAEARKRRAAAAALAKREAAARRKYIPTDRRRIADILEIQKALDLYIRDVGPLPAPAEYGEQEPSKQTGFWKGYWDVSSDDGDGDGLPFLDFLVESGLSNSVPLDPENESTENGDPRGGRQYVYFLLPPGSDYAGGPSQARADRWHYLLGITDLQSEISRPPTNFSGSGCEPLWRDQPNFFQQHFDYVVCGSFDATAEERERGGGVPGQHSDAIPKEDLRR